MFKLLTLGLACCLPALPATIAYTQVSSLINSVFESDSPLVRLQLCTSSFTCLNLFSANIGANSVGFAQTMDANSADFPAAVGLLNDPWTYLMKLQPNNSGSGNDIAEEFGLEPNSPLFPNATISAITVTVVGTSWARSTPLVLLGVRTFRLDVAIIGEGDLPQARIPEPSTWLLCAVGLFGLVWRRKLGALG